MKILAAGDIHGDIDQVKKLAKRAKEENVDLIILSGDLTLAETSTKGLIGPFKETGKAVILLPGNHESIATVDALAEQYGLVSLHGYAIYIGDVGIFGVGSANLGIFQLAEKELYDLLKQGFEKIKDKKKKIMVTHVHPDKTISAKLTAFPGSLGVRKAIESFKPDIAIFSHIHEGEGLEENLGATKLFNVGKSGKIIEI